MEKKVILSHGLPLGVVNNRQGITLCATDLPVGILDKAIPFEKFDLSGQDCYLGYLSYASHTAYVVLFSNMANVTGAYIPTLLPEDLMADNDGYVSKIVHASFDIDPGTLSLHIIQGGLSIEVDGDKDGEKLVVYPLYTSGDDESSVPLLDGYVVMLESTTKLVDCHWSFDNSETVPDVTEN